MGGAMGGWMWLACRTNLRRGDGWMWVYMCVCVCMGFSCRVYVCEILFVRAHAPICIFASARTCVRVYLCVRVSVRGCV